MSSSNVGTLDLRQPHRNASPMKTTASMMLAAVFLIGILIFAGCQTSSPQKSNIIELFNGANFDGWTFCMKNNADPKDTWSVSDGVIHCTGQPYGYARTEQSFHDYQLTVIWRFVKVAPHADNSGIFVQTQLPDKVFPECVQCQGLYQHQGDLILEGGARADGYPVGPKNITIPQAGPQNENPAGEWNTNQIICQGSAIKLFVNGRMMNQITGCNLSSGFVGIQAEGGDIEVRRLSLEHLQ
jgi:hypothetical protein